jgi:hypothetical protein
MEQLYYRNYHYHICEPSEGEGISIIHAFLSFYTAIHFMLHKASNLVC